MSASMKCPPAMRLTPALVMLALLASTSICSAQSTPSGNMLDAPPVQKNQAKREIGDVTSSLLRMQAEGTAAGAALPMLGATSTISWERYKDSFAYPIPEYFGRTVKKSEGQ
ncbi:hypothetical protein D3C72_135000 [compost metagenome]